MSLDFPESGTKGSALGDMDLSREEFGRRMRAARIAAGWASAGAAARALGMLPTSYNRLELGQQVPSFARLLTIMRILKLDPRVIAPEFFEKPRGR